MPQSLACVMVHLVFSTKNRAPLIRELHLPELHAYLSAVLREHGCQSLRVGGVQDHVHLLFALSRTTTLAQTTEKVKTSSSKWIKTKGPDYALFQWQGGYGAFSVGQAEADAVEQYILGQAEHHCTMTFQEELRSFLDRHGVAYDERYVWD